MYLKSGSPSLLVISCDGHYVEVTWTNKDNIIQGASFTEVLLADIEPEIDNFNERLN